MKKIYRIFLLFLLIFFISIPVFGVEDTSLTILFTHDIHDNLEPNNIKVNNKIESRGGFSRLSTAIAEERKIDENLLLLDAGDYSMGTLFQTIFTSQAPSLRLMGKLGYDATTFGNHEFDFRTKGLTQNLQSAVDSGDTLPAIVASNTKFPENNLHNNNSLEDLKISFEDYGVKDYLVLDRNNIKIGIIGLMGEDSDSNAPMAEVEFTDIIKESKKLVDILKNEENVDLIVAISHSGTAGKEGKSEDEILAKKVSGIDIIISGHSHSTLLEPIIINNTIIASSGNYTKNLGVMNIINDDGKWKLQNYNIKKIDDSYDNDPKIDKLIEKFKKDIEDEYLSKFDLKYDEVIASSNFNFTPVSALGKVQEEEPLGYLIGDGYKYAIKEAEQENYRKVDVAVVASGVIRDSFTKGDIMVKDVFQVSSLGIGKDKLAGYPLIDVYLTGKELKTAAEIDASVQPIMGAAQLYMSGLKYSFNPNRIIFNKVTDINLETNNGKIKLADDKLYRVVANLYTGQMLDLVNDKSKGLLSIIPKDEDGNEVLDFEDRILYNDGEEIKEWLALAEYLQSFPEKDGIPQIPEYYSKKQDRKIVDNDNSLKAKLTKLNRISIAIIFIPIILLILTILLTRFFIRRKKNKIS
ncbi:MAG TPA: bifunctional UDP-sugar hydrolase/5'-nucleotidase [Tissierellaceae bacterium]|nr:bifunctional UDP-sugar hydrolase/5'-nucleotidase [Tissierellaceae bacterium]